MNYYIEFHTDNPLQFRLRIHFIVEFYNFSFSGPSFYNLLTVLPGLNSFTCTML
jgi:hypothetical protein